MGVITHASVGTDLTRDAWESPSIHLIGGEASQPIVRATTYVVAASDAPTHVKAQADYVCDGTADNIEIQAAIDALLNNIGCIVLSEGIYNISTMIAFPTQAAYPSCVITLKGQGRENTKLRLAANIDLLDISGYDPTHMSIVTVRDMTLENPGRLYTSGRGIIAYNSSFFLDNLYITNFVDEGVDIQDSAEEWYILNSRIYHNGNDTGGTEAAAIKIAGSGSPLYVVNGWIKDSDISCSRYRAVEATGTYSLYIENNIFEGYPSGVDMTPTVLSLSGARQHILNNYFLYTSGAAIIITGNGIDNFHIKDNLFDGIAGSAIELQLGAIRSDFNIQDNDIRNCAGYGIDLYGINQGLVTGNSIVLTDDTKYGIRVIGDPYEASRDSYVTIEGNYLENTAGISASPFLSTNYRYIIRNNQGYVTENSGTATVANGQTTVVVSHGLSTTPTRVLITATLWSNAAKAWVTTLTSTQFTINVDANPGAGTATFNWRTQVGEG